MGKNGFEKAREIAFGEDESPIKKGVKCKEIKKNSKEIWRKNIFQIQLKFEKLERIVLSNYVIAISFALSSRL